MRLAVCFILSVLLAASSSGRAAGPATNLSTKKLIEFGWDEPDTAFMRKHIRQMEQTPFDGCVFDIGYKDSTGKTGRFMADAWGQRRFSTQDVQSAIDDLKATRFIRFTENFLRFDVTPGDVDWFDDFSAVIGNTALAAKVARAGKARGILFDCEPY